MQVPESVKKERSERLIALCNSVRDELLSGLVLSGEPLFAIAEACEGGVYSGHTDTYVQVAFASDKELSGDVVKLHPVSHKAGVVFCELLN